MNFKDLEKEIDFISNNKSLLFEEKICKINELILKVNYQMLTTLKEMKQQEFDYWEAWKKAKEEENGSGLTIDSVKTYSYCNKRCDEQHSCRWSKSFNG